MLVRHLNSIASVDELQGIDVAISHLHIITRSQQAPETANGGFKGPSSGEESIAGVVMDFTVFGFKFGGFLRHGATGGFVVGEVRDLVLTAAIGHDFAAGTAHQVLGLVTDGAP